MGEQCKGHVVIFNPVFFIYGREMDKSSFFCMYIECLCQIINYTCKAKTKNEQFFYLTALNIFNDDESKSKWLINSNYKDKYCKV